MIDEFIARFDAARPALLARFSATHPESYAGIFEMVVDALQDDEQYDCPDPERIQVVDHGHYQGTQLFIVGAKGYQPDRYWACKVSYGSCSGCDTFEAIRSYSDEPPTEEQAAEYMTLALHMVQELKEI